MKKNFCICEKPIKHIKDESRPDLFGCARCGKPSENQLAEKQQDGWDVMMAASKVTYAGADRPRKFAKKLAEMIKEAMSRPFPDEAKASPQPIDLRYFRPDGEKIIVEQKPQAKSPTDDPVFSSRALWPKDVSTVQEPAVDVAHFSDISINCNLGREELFEQGRSGPSCIGGVIVANMNCDLPEKIEVF